MGFIKNIGFFVICGIMIVWSGGNIYRQVTTIMEARVENDSLEAKIADLENEITRLKARVEYATSSGANARANREVLGRGTEDDYWIVVKGLGSEVELPSKLNEVTEETNLRKWWKLFTK